MGQPGESVREWPEQPMNEKRWATGGKQRNKSTHITNGNGSSKGGGFIIQNMSGKQKDVTKMANWVAKKPQKTGDISTCSRPNQVEPNNLAMGYDIRDEDLLVVDFHNRCPCQFNAMTA